MPSDFLSHPWSERLHSSAKAIVVGLVLFGFSILLLFWNELKAVDWYRTLNEIRDRIIVVDSEAVSEANEGALVHVLGTTTVEDALKDPRFEV